MRISMNSSAGGKLPRGARTPCAPALETGMSTSFRCTRLCDTDVQNGATCFANPLGPSSDQQAANKKSGTNQLRLKHWASLRAVGFAMATSLEVLYIRFPHDMILGHTVFCKACITFVSFLIDPNAPSESV